MADQIRILNSATGDGTDKDNRADLHVLLVEDEPGDAMLVEIALGKLRPPARISRAASLRQCFDFAAANTAFDVALVDLSLPDSTGLATVSEIRKAFPTVPIIVLTGLDDARLEEQIVGSGAQDYLIKGSFRGDALTRAIRHALVRHRLERNLAESELRNRTMIEIAPDAILVISPQGRILSSNPAAIAMFGAEQPGSLDGLPLDQILPDAPALITSFTESHGGRQDGTAIRKKGRFPVAMAGAPLSDGCVMLLVSDMTERVFLTQHLQELVRTDPLTGLSNRRAFIEVADVEFHRFRRTGLTSALLMVDIDHFKAVNDRYGHQAGDDALCALARVLSGNIRMTDTAVRFGGEEFVLLMSGTDLEGGRDMADRVRAEVARIAVGSDEGRFGFTVSIGVASFLPEDTDWQETLRRADEGLYQAKSTGRNRVVTVEHPVAQGAVQTG